MKVIACIEDPVVMPKALAALAGQALQKILNHLKEKGDSRMRFDCPRFAARRKRAYLGKENSFAEHKNVAGDTRQGWRSADGLV